jgi:SPP1 family phage portal protein
MYLTDNDLIKQQLFAMSEITDSSILKNIIASDCASEIKQNMFYGKEYYKSNNTEISKRTFTYASNGKKIADEYRTNNKLKTGFLKTLIDQKINYSLSKKVIIDDAENINSVIDVNSFLKKTAKESSKKAVGWLFVGINENGELNLKPMLSEEIIPIYDTQFEDELIQVIRYYTMSVINGSTAKNIYKAEIWDKEKVTFYSEDTDGNFILDYAISINPVTHYTITTFQMGEPVETIGHSWGKVPFVPLWNNDDHLTDLNPVKFFIDLYDKVSSDFGNNLEDLQDSIIKLKNYGGQTDKLDEFIEYLKLYKVLPIDAQGDAEYMTLEIPVEARKTALNILNDLIFKFGQGMDVDKVGDGNITNVVIRSRYAGLDLKANDFEGNVEEFLKNVFWFVNEYLKLKGMQQDNINKIKFTFNRSIIVNNQEVVDMAVKSKGMISDRTIIKNHPWVDDVDEEIEQMEKEKQANIELYGLGNNMSADDNSMEKKEETSLNPVVANKGAVEDDNES